MFKIKDITEETVAVDRLIMLSFGMAARPIFVEQRVPRNCVPVTENIGHSCSVRIVSECTTCSDTPTPMRLQTLISSDLMKKLRSPHRVVHTNRHRLGYANELNRIVFLRWLHSFANARVNENFRSLQCDLYQRWLNIL